MFFCRKSKSSSLPNPAIDNPIGDDKLNRLQAVYKIAMQNREFEISQLIQRNNFFMLFQGVFLAAVFQNQASKPYIEFWLSLLGIFMSLYQAQVAAGAKYWQEYWEVRLGEIEKRLEAAMRERKGGDFFFEPLFSEKAKLLDIERKVKKKDQNKVPWMPESVSYMVHAEETLC